MMCWLFNHRYVYAHTWDERFYMSCVRCGHIWTI